MGSIPITRSRSDCGDGLGGLGQLKRERYRFWQHLSFGNNGWMDQG
ncbi:MAG: hypothetical protein RI549_02105 [Wenzhouxiangella sp.]|nr:hypothetical protein [Wenzhouxiangella sp.]